MKYFGITFAALLFAVPLSASSGCDDELPALFEDDFCISEEKPVRYRDPELAMRLRYKQSVDIEIEPSWGLSEKQMITALYPPFGIVRGNRIVRYVYPEDEEPTAEQMADGSALTTAQRQHMRRARKAALRRAARQARAEAVRYNTEHAALIEATEKQGRHIMIDLTTQRGCLKDGEEVVRTFRVCSGKKSTPTPTGHFRVIEKHREHKSNLYHCSMPFFMRLTYDGVGLHQGPVRSRPSSHGCIRLHEKDALFIFESCEVGTAVFVEASAPAEPLAKDAKLRMVSGPEVRRH